MLQLVIDKLDAVAEPLRELYTEKEGKFHLNVTGVEDTSGLKSALQKERDAVKVERQRAKELEEKFAGIDPVRVKDMLSKLDQDGEAALIAAGKIDEVIEKRSTKLRNELQKQVDEAHKLTQAEKVRADKFSQRVLDNNIRAAAAKAGLHTHAVEDALFRARNMFTLTEDGEAVQLDEDGTPVLGKDGKTPFSPAEWLEGMRETAPHWFPAGNGGGGAGGNKDTKGSSKVMKRSEFNELSPARRAEVVRTHAIVD